MACGLAQWRYREADGREFSETAAMNTVKKVCVNGEVCASAGSGKSDKRGISLPCDEFSCSEQGKGKRWCECGREHRQEIDAACGRSRAKWYHARSAAM